MRLNERNLGEAKHYHQARWIMPNNLFYSQGVNLVSLPDKPR